MGVGGRTAGMQADVPVDGPMSHSGDCGGWLEAAIGSESFLTATCSI